MKTFNFNGKILESWWSLLKHLSNDMKLELASRLIDSIKSPVPAKEVNSTDWKKLCGAWKDEKESAEELIVFLKNSRLTNRQIESFN